MKNVPIIIISVYIHVSVKLNNGLFILFVVKWRLIHIIKIIFIILVRRRLLLLMMMMVAVVTIIVIVQSITKPRG